MKTVRPIGKDEKVIWADTGWACAGLVVDSKWKIVDAANIFQSAIGKTLDSSKLVQGDNPNFPERDLIKAPWLPLL